jgi:Transglycosylase-like domain
MALRLLPLLLLVALYGAAPAQAQEVVVPEAVATAAATAGVDPVDLLGATLTTRLPAMEYLYRTGELARPVPPPPPAPAYGVWDRLAECEASGIWSNASNPRYKGGLQMDATFWRRYGGLAFAPAPHLATRAQQITVAQRGQAVQGWGAWPACSRRLGLR